jgi:hypothetical protein
VLRDRAEKLVVQGCLAQQVRPAQSGQRVRRARPVRREYRGRRDRGGLPGQSGLLAQLDLRERQARTLRLFCELSCSDARQKGVASQSVARTSTP